MIPASYLYKDIYSQTWLDADIECARARQSKHGGGHPIRNLFATLLARIAARPLRPAPRPSLAPVPH